MTKTELKDCIGKHIIIKNMTKEQVKLYRFFDHFIDYRTIFKIEKEEDGLLTVSRPKLKFKVPVLYLDCELCNPQDKWVITYVSPPYPTNVGKIEDVLYDKNNNIRAYEIRSPYGLSFWEDYYCKIFDTEKEAQKEYDNFTQNKNNYAPEG